MGILDPISGCGDRRPGSASERGATVVLARAAATTLVVAAALVIAPTLLRAQTSGDAPASPGLPPPVVRLSVGDSGVSIPDILPSGLVRLRLVSRGERARRVVLTRLRPGQEAVSYLSGAEGWLEGRSFGRWGEDPGSPGLVAPGDSTDVVVSLHPGRYVAAVWGETPGGAVRIDPSSRAIFEVLEPPPGIPRTRAPTADLTVEVSDHDYRLSGPLEPGPHVIEVVNRGPQEHDFQLGRLVEDATVAEARAWLQGGMRGTAPVEFVGGLVGLSPGHRGWLDVALTPGRYVVLCLVPDVSDRRPHVDHGMLTAVDVPSPGAAPADGGP